MTITITGSNGEFLYNIVTYGENCSIIESDKDGKFVEKITREETTGDDETRSYTAPIIPSNPWAIPTPVPCCRDNTKLQCTW